jgi:hypothetical protein
MYVRMFFNMYIVAFTCVTDAVSFQFVGLYFVNQK